MIRTNIKFQRALVLKHQFGVYEIRSMKTMTFARATVKGIQPDDFTLSYEITGHWESHDVHGQQLNITSWKPHPSNTAEQIASLSRLYS